MPRYVIFLDPIGITAEEPEWRTNFKFPADVLDIEATDELFYDAEVTPKPHQTFKAPKSLAAKWITSGDLEDVENGTRPVNTMYSEELIIT